MQHFLLFLISVSFLALFSGTVSARNETLMVVTEHMPPFQIIDKNPKRPVEGYSVEVLKSTLKLAHIDYAIVPMDWDRAYSLGQKKPNTLVLSMVRKPEREKMFHWLIKLSDSQTSLWGYRNNPKVITSLAEITNEIIAINRHDHHQLTLKKYPNLTNKNFLFTKSKEQAIALVAKQRADYFMANDFILNWRLKFANIDKKNLVEVFQFTQQNNELYIAASHDTSLRIRNKIKHAYAQLQANGEIKSIADKWFSAQ